MANKPKSLYLTDRTMSALRGDEALSGRMNQIVDRYLRIIEGDHEAVRAQFGAASWQAMLAALPVHRMDTLDESRTRLAAIGGDVVTTMSTTDLVILLELLERDRAEAVLAVHP